jgi:hypothetical protein
MAVLVDRGMLLASARGPVPNVAELVAGEPIRGSWWGHPAGSEIYHALGALADSPDVVRLRLINRKITLVHRRVWPALVRVAPRFHAQQLTAVDQEHTPSGAHRNVEIPYPGWVPADVVAAASTLSEAEAFAALPQCLHPRWGGDASRADWP